MPESHRSVILLNQSFFLPDLPACCEEDLMSVKLAPVALFVYNRLDHTRRTVEALLQNTLAVQSDVFVFCDGAKEYGDPSVQAVRDYIRTVSGFNSVTVVERDENAGLATSIIEGISDVVDKYGSVIVLEDDLITSPYFLEYMNTCLVQYERTETVFSIAGWSPPTLADAVSEYSVAYLPRNCSWGWATWKDRWASVDWNVSDYATFKTSRARQNEFNRGGVDLSRMLAAQMKGTINSWAIRFCYSQYVQNKLTVFPLRSYVENIGCDGSGTHCDTSVVQQAAVAEEQLLHFPEAVQIDLAVLECFAAFYRPAPFMLRLINKISRTVTGKNIIAYENTAS